MKRAVTAVIASQSRCSRWGGDVSSDLTLVKHRLEIVLGTTSLF